MLSQYQASTDAEDGESGVDPRSDKELALAAREDPAVFGILYERHVSTIYRYVYYRVGNREDAEDLNARVFMRALKHIQRFDDRGVPFTAWLYRIAHNVTYDWLRKRKIQGDGEFDDERTDHRVAAGAETVPTAFAAPDVAMKRAELGERIQNAIAQLSPDHRQAVVLREVEGLSY